MKKLIAAILPALIINACYYKTEVTNIEPKGHDEETIDFESGLPETGLWHKPDTIKKIKDELNITLPVNAPSEKLDKNDRKAIIISLKDALENKVETAKKIDKATENMVKLAVFHLKLKGYIEEAKEIEDEYLGRYQNYTYLYAIGATQDIGDHPPMWEWLDKLEKDLREKLGDFVMQVTRLEDMRTFNYGIPVVLQPAGDERFDPPVLISKLDYSQHFIPLSGALSYWVTWGACVGATWGAGAVTFICAPMGMIVERVVETKIAPPLSDKIWENANQ